MDATSESDPQETTDYKVLLWWLHMGLPIEVYRGLVWRNIEPNRTGWIQHCKLHPNVYNERFRLKPADLK